MELAHIEHIDNPKIPYGIIQTEIFKFDQLDDDAKERAIQDYHENGLDHEWWQFVYDDVKEIGKLIGIEIDRIYFSGFWTQGDGACFEGSYEYKKGSVKAVKKYAPLDTDLHQIATDLYLIQRPSFYQLSATVKQFGHYYHSGCTQIDVENGMEYRGYATADQENGIKEALRAFMDWIYSQLEKEYEYITSDEQIIETIEMNEWLFLENGEFACN